MSRIKNTFAALSAQGKKGLIPFMTAGDPDPARTVEFMHALAAGGADVIELGVPFSDPMADGPVIQASSERALAHGVSLRHVLADVKRFREKDDKTPIVLMGYANPIERMGADAFATAAKEPDVDRWLVVVCGGGVGGRLGRGGGETRRGGRWKISSMNWGGAGGAGAGPRKKTSFRCFRG